MAGHRPTAARRTVHGALVDDEADLTPDDAAALADQDVNLATVSRVAAPFYDWGLARVDRLGSDTSTWWELAHPDDHVVCRRRGDADHHVGDAGSPSTSAYDGEGR